MVIIYPPEEFQRLGFTIEQLFARFLGEEYLDFVGYHQRRTSLNLFVHSCLPFSYFLIHRLKFSVFATQEPLEDFDLDPDFPMPQEAVAFKTLTWKTAQRFSVLAVLAMPALIFNWHQENWRRHPISKALSKYSITPGSYSAVASEIGIEFRQPEIYKKKLNSISSVIATQNWIIKTTMYNVHFAHQSNTSLSVAKVSGTRFLCMCDPNILSAGRNLQHIASRPKRHLADDKHYCTANEAGCERLPHTN